jgi:hypothetical protein
MKKTLITIVLLSLFIRVFSQWELSLTCNAGESIAGISAPSNDIIWVITQNFFIYRTVNGGGNWKRIKCRGLDNNISLAHFYVLNASIAFISVSKNTGVGPGLIYKTSDSGHSWKLVFTHKGTCTIKLGMFSENKGLMACSFDSFDGSVKSGQALYSTPDGGDSWIRDTADPARNFIMNLEIKGKQAALTDYKNFYWSGDRGNSFSVSDNLKQPSDPKYNLQFEDSNYAILNAGNLVDILVKCPGTGGWIDMNVPPGIDNGFITGIVLDGNECWMTEAFDTNKLYYSSDSAKTFTSSVPVVNSSFQFLTKARRGRTLIGGTPSFMSGKIYINTRGPALSGYPVAFKDKDHSE